MGRRIVWRDDGPAGGLEWAPPVMVVAVVTLFASTLDLMADFLVCSRIAEFLGNFHSRVAVVAAYGYFFFTGVSIFVYIFEMVDVCQTLKYEEENVFYARLAKSLVLALEEVPLPALLNVLFTSEPRLSLAGPVFFGSCIKLVALTWGLVKFTKLRFFWPCLPLNPKHSYRSFIKGNTAKILATISAALSDSLARENVRRCFTLNLYRCTMIVVNICHLLAIFIVTRNIMASKDGGRPIVVKNETA